MNSRILVTVAFAGLLGCRGADGPPSSAAASPETLGGAWVGHVSEGIAYEVCMSVPLDLSRPGSIKYFGGISCGGSLQYQGATGAIHTFSETLTFGNLTNGGKCADTGRIEATINSDGSMQWQWFQPGSKAVQVAGVLRRQSQCP